MTRTEHDLRDALRTLEDDAPRLEDVLPTVRGEVATRRGRHLAVAATVAAALVVSGGAALLANSRGDDNGAADRTTQTTRNVTASAAIPLPGVGGLGTAHYTTAPVTGYVLTDHLTTELFERIDLASPDGAAPSVTLYKPGKYDGTKTGTPVQVGSHRGVIVAKAHPTFVAYRATDPAYADRAVVWQYAPDAWAMVAGATGESVAATDAANLAIARSVRPAATRLTIPFTVGYLPAGVDTESAGSAVTRPREGSVGPYGGVSFRDATPPVGTMPSWGAAFDLYAFVVPKLATLGYTCDAKAAGFTVQGHRGCFLRAKDARTAGLQVTIDQHAVRLLLNAGHFGRYTDAELVRVVGSVRLVPDFTDTSSWHPVG